MPTDRGAAGMFLAFQHPEAIPGVSVIQFLRQALSNRTGTDLTVLELRLKVMDAMKELGIESSFADRYLNEGFSGGERKRNEVLQMAVLEPELAIMDETDSGLDIDALRTVADGVNKLTTPERGFLIITHYQRLLDYITPDVVHIFMDGRILESGGPELAEKLEEEGYDSFRTVIGQRSERPPSHLKSDLPSPRSPGSTSSTRGRRHRSRSRCSRQWTASPAPLRQRPSWRLQAVHRRPTPTKRPGPGRQIHQRRPPRTWCSPGAPPPP
jgi:Fe-S cluster assembly ATPase SufC